MLNKTMGVGLAIIMCAAVRAADTAPAAPEQSATPMQVVQQFATAAREGKAEAMLALLDVPEAQRTFVTAYVQLAAASGSLYQTSESHFGKAATEKVFSSLDLVPAAGGDATEADSRIEGDSATVTVKDAARAIQLKRAGGQWKIDVATTFRLDTAKLPDGQQIVALTAAVNATRSRIKADAFATPQAALEDLRARMLEALSKAAVPAATSAPATTTASTAP